MTSESRVRIEPDGDGVRLHLPGPRSRWRIAAAAGFVPLAAYVVLGNVVLVRNAVTSTHLEQAGAAVGIWAVTLVLLVLVDVPMLLAVVALLWQLTGTEVVRATPWMLADERRVLGLPFRRTWACLRVSHLRLAPQSGGAPAPHLLGRRGVLFVVDDRHVRGIGEGCTPAEAAEVFEAVDAALHAPTITR